MATTAKFVLILILLEYGLQLLVVLNVDRELTAVLILILLEYGLQREISQFNGIPCSRLNPYSTGIWSATPVLTTNIGNLFVCLNPYSTGIWSATRRTLPVWY